MNNTTLKMHKQKKSNVNTCSLCTQHKKCQLLSLITVTVLFLEDRKLQTAQVHFYEYSSY